MKSHINLPLAAMLLGALASCSTENPFDPGVRESGFLSRDALEVELKNEDHITRAGLSDLSDLMVEIVREDGEVEESYRLADMPEVVALPVGDYTVRASYGENPVAAWDAPYYYGEQTFSISADKITTDIDPVVCTLANVKVTIAFDSHLAEKMGPDATVTVVAGEQGEESSLVYTINETRAGYFAYVPGTSLAATFSGTVDGEPVNETKAYDEVEAGTHYNVVFRLRTLDKEETGQITTAGGITLDASVEKQDVTANLEAGMTPVKDDMRPVEGGGSTPENPDPPVNPGTDLEKAINIHSENFDINEVQQIEDLETAVILIETENPIESFTVDIISNTLTPEELEGVGLGDHLDLVNPGEFGDAISGLFFEGGEIKVSGEKSVTFDLTQFLPLLSALGEGQHTFRLTVGTSDGTRTVELKLKNN